MDPSQSSLVVFPRSGAIQFGSVHLGLQSDRRASHASLLGIDESLGGMHGWTENLNAGQLQKESKIGKRMRKQRHVVEFTSHQATVASPHKSRGTLHAVRAGIARYD